MSHISIIRRSFCVFIIPAFFLVLLSGCGGSSDSGYLIPPKVSEEEILQGIFVDSPVSGVTYITPEHRGTTNIDGIFDYEEGETITFLIAGIVLGRTLAKDVITPLDLVDNAEDVTDTAVTNICRLLLFLDTDGDPDNGIAIPEDLTRQLAGPGFKPQDIDFSDPGFDDNLNIKTLIIKLNQAGVFDEEERTLCTPEFAQEHLAETLLLYGLVDLEPVAGIVFPVVNLNLTSPTRD
ncbi:MAG TPA: hypothetical protein ENN05_05345 [Deltaproteobacteria bacterium]|nr:hypothetical protein [Deltaproteobacteria bacterium]